MADDIEKIARFEDTINKEADAEINSMLSEAKENADEAVRSACERYQEKSSDIISDEIKKMKSRYEHAVSQKSFEASREVIAHRNEAVEQFFSELEKKLIAYSSTEEYKEYLAKEIGEINAERAFTSSVKIYVRSTDAEVVRKLYPDVCVQADKKIKLGGANVFYPDEGICIDKTLDNLFEQQKAEFVNNAFMRL